MNNEEAPGTFLDIRTAANRLGVNPETLRRWDRKGTLRAYRTPGGYRRFLASDIAKVLKTRKNEE